MWLPSAVLSCAVGDRARVLVLDVELGRAGVDARRSGRAAVVGDHDWRPSSRCRSVPLRAAVPRGCLRRRCRSAARSAAAATTATTRLHRDDRTRTGCRCFRQADLARQQPCGAGASPGGQHRGVPSDYVREQPDFFAVGPASAPAAIDMGAGIWCSPGMSSTATSSRPTTAASSSTPACGSRRRTHKRNYDAVTTAPDALHRPDAEPHRSHRWRRHVPRSRHAARSRRRTSRICQADDVRIHGLRIRRSLPFFADVMGQPGFARGDDVEIPPLAKPAEPDITFDDTLRVRRAAAARSSCSACPAARRSTRSWCGCPTTASRSSATCSPRSSATSRTS